jgi:hypothetical protein
MASAFSALRVNVPELVEDEERVRAGSGAHH